MWQRDMHQSRKNSPGGFIASFSRLRKICSYLFLNEIFDTPWGADVLIDDLYSGISDFCVDSGYSIAAADKKGTSEIDICHCVEGK